jgi:hypothetical protein
MDDSLKFEARRRVHAERLVTDAGYLYDGSYAVRKDKRAFGVDGFFYEGDWRYALLDFKFDRYPTGRLAIEFLSVDRPGAVLGWLFTSYMGWLGYWLVASGELLVVHMDELRKFVLANPLADRRATTALNPNTGQPYLSWSVLLDLTTILRECPSARLVDVRRYSADKEVKARAPHIVGNPKHKYANRVCNMHGLVAHFMSGRYRASTEPLEDTVEDVIGRVQELIPYNLKAKDEKHDPMIRGLSWARDIHNGLFLPSNALTY